MKRLATAAILVLLALLLTRATPYWLPCSTDAECAAADDAAALLRWED